MADRGSRGDPPAWVEPFTPHALTDVELRELTALHNAVYLETRPLDPPRPPHFAGDLYPSLAEAKAFERHFFRARLAGALVGALTVSRRRIGGNARVLHLELLVHPDARRRRIGSALVARATALARANGQDTLIGLVTGADPLRERPGGRFLASLGGHQGLAHRIYRLELRDVDRRELQRWQREGAERSPDIELSWRFDAFADQELEDISRLMQAMNGAPRGRLKVEPTVHTPESVADRDRALLERGYRRTVLLARERSHSRLLGYTMMMVDPYDERLFRQADTAVEPAARGRGLGMWLKAAMLLHMMDAHPTRSEVRTGTADANASMLAINRRMGFRPWLAHSVWQAPLEQLEDALRSLEPRTPGVLSPTAVDR